MPSARAKPSAAASNVLEEASGERIPSPKKFDVSVGARIKLVPPTIAPDMSLACRARQASWRATSDAEQAVLITTLRVVSVMMMAEACKREKKSKCSGERIRKKHRINKQSGKE
jgi:hypothetical protein